MSFDREDRAGLREEGREPEALGDRVLSVLIDDGGEGVTGEQSRETVHDDAPGDLDPEARGDALDLRKVGEGIDEKEEAPAAGYEALDHSAFGREEVLLGARNQEDRAIGRDRVPEGEEVLDREAFGLDRALQLAQTGLLRVVDRFFAVPGETADDLLRLARHLENRVRELLLGDLGKPLLVSAALGDDRSVALDLVTPRRDRVLVRIDE